LFITVSVSVADAEPFPVVAAVVVAAAAAAATTVVDSWISVSLLLRLRFPS
jgi:hypothetical protein